MLVHEVIGVPATLELCAEECAELAHACLKMARYLRKENPTPVNSSIVHEMLKEEVADVFVSIQNLRDANLFNFEEVYGMELEKIARRDKMLEEKVKENENA